MRRKLFHVIVILLGASLVLSSCEKAGGDEGSEDTIVGTWVCVEQAAALEDGTSVTYSDKEDWLEKYTYIAFWTMPAVPGRNIFAECSKKPEFARLFWAKASKISRA